MGRGEAAGVPIFFMCHKLRKVWPRTDRDRRQHRETPTGRTRKLRTSGKGHPRKAARELEYSCICGHTGWSNHISLAERAVRMELADPEVVFPRYRGRGSGPPA